MKENGGIITQQDLEEYKAEELEPIHATYRGYDIYLFHQVKAIYSIIFNKRLIFFVESGCGCICKEHALRFL